MNILIAFVAISFILGLFLSLIWTKRTWLNLFIKVAFILYTFFAGGLLLGLCPQLVTAGIHIF